MDVPYRSSGSSSRQHYALVRKVETEHSASAADQHILLEVEAVRGEISDPGLSLKRCKELLIILLYCHSAVTSNVFENDTFHFAIPHALNLAEAGANVRDKRLGYLFCTEIMPSNHELQLMLVNTLRKDLESLETARICLALDNLISSSTDDMIPAVQPRLHDLLGHNSPHVRRRVLLTFRALSRHDEGIMQTLAHTLCRRLKDPDASISAAALMASTAFGKSDELYKHVNELFASSPHHRSRYWLLVGMRAIQVIGLRDDYLHIVVRLIRTAAAHKDHPILLAAYLLISSMRSESFLTVSSTSRRALVTDIRDILFSEDPDEQYLFLACIDCVDPKWWAGTTPEVPTVLEEQEVGRFMRFLDSPDSLIRRKAVTILNKIDRTIVSTYYAQSVENIPDGLAFDNKVEYTCRLLEVLELQYADDGEGYARQVIDLFKKLEPPAPESGRLLDVAVEKILTCVRDNTSMFKIASATIFLGYLLEGNDVGPTLMVVIAALACEYCGALSFPPEDILNGLSSRLLSLSVSLQDVCLITMLRVSAECDHVSDDVRTVVSHLSSLSKSYIRKRCDQFLNISSDKELLLRTLRSAKSYTLPHVVEALTNVGTEGTRSSGSSGARKGATMSPSSSPSLSASKLRYAAYDAPTIPKPRPRPRRRASVARSETDSLDSVLSRTMTPGELTLATQELEALSLSPPPLTKEPGQSPLSRPDLIAFDTPFLTDPPLVDESDLFRSEKPAPENFETMWNSLEQATSSRGWFEGSPDALVDRLKGLQDVEVAVVPPEEAPFIGEVKVLVQSSKKKDCAALRVKASDEEGCLWRLRCADAQMRVVVKRLLSDEGD
ncbi:ARM repeat-containing protein [Hymenopellis radicata]|nr:ARM repeat-containing protein [Hymenopellis radicata]